MFHIVRQKEAALVGICCGGEPDTQTAINPDHHWFLLSCRMEQHSPPMQLGLLITMHLCVLYPANSHSYIRLHCFSNWILVVSCISSVTHLIPLSQQIRAVFLIIWFLYSGIFCTLFSLGAFGFQRSSGSTSLVPWLELNFQTILLSNFYHFDQPLPSWGPPL